ncbi:MAG: Flagellar biosynthesis protein FliQ, partial [uncultured Thermoleophilia bacterium]
ERGVPPGTPGRDRAGGVQAQPPDAGGRPRRGAPDLDPAGRHADPGADADLRAEGRGRGRDHARRGPVDAEHAPGLHRRGLRPDPEHDRGRRL